MARVNDQEMGETERAEAFRQLQTNHLRAQTSALGTMKALSILWTVIGVLGLILLVISTLHA